MTPIEMIKEGIKVKSWAMVKAALKELESTPVYQIPDTKTPPQDIDNMPNISLEDFEGHLNNPKNPNYQAKKTNNKNLFYDDGKVTKIGNSRIDSAQSDRTIKYKPPTERNRAPYKQKYMKCTKCSKKHEVSDLEYAYYKNPMNEADYICQNCT